MIISKNKYTTCIGNSQKGKKHTHSKWSHVSMLSIDLRFVCNPVTRKFTHKKISNMFSNGLDAVIHKYATHMTDKNQPL